MTFKLPTLEERNAQPPDPNRWNDDYVPPLHKWIHSLEDRIANLEQIVLKRELEEK